MCRAAVGRGWHVTSISSSGRPALTPGGHARAWTQSVEWVAASAFEPHQYASLVGESTAVVHTLGILMENNYKEHVRRGNLLGLLGAVVGGRTGNPLAQAGKPSMTYESMNRDAGARGPVRSNARPNPFRSPARPSNDARDSDTHLHDRNPRTRPPIHLRLGGRHLSPVHPGRIHSHQTTGRTGDPCALCGFGRACVGGWSAGGWSVGWRCCPARADATR